MKKLNTKGFAVIWFIVGLVVIGLAGGGVYYRYNSSKNNNVAQDTNAPTPSPAIDEDKKTPGPTVTPKQLVDTKNWLEYKGKKYTIRFADGWKLRKKGNTGQYADSFFTNKNEDIKFRMGQKAIIAPHSAASNEDENTEPLYGFFIDYDPRGTDEGCTEITGFKAEFAFNTAGGNKVYRKIHIGNREVRADELGLAKGEKSYLYCVQLKGSAQLRFGYILKTTTMEDHSKTIEKVIKTIVAL